MRRIERCACGGFIAVASLSPDLIFAAVYQHNRSDLHMAWRMGGIA
ncbi:MAG: hypothetical protein ACR2JV_06270 [Gaiellales bacterium]